MSTSPSWFDQDKFSRLVKKVGPKSATTQPVAGQAAPPKAPSQPLIKEAALPPEATGKTSLPARKSPPTESTRLSQRLPKIELKSLTSEPDIVPAPIRAEAGALPNEIEEEAPALVEKNDRPPISLQGMMTSQSLSLGKKSSSPDLPAGALTTEPIRAPEASISKTPPLPEGAQPSPGTIHRTTALPAMKSLFQYEIPGGQGIIPAKEPAEPSAPKPPAFSFQKLETKTPAQTFPPVQDEEEDVPSFSGVSDAGHLPETAEEEEELSAENLAAEWGKSEDLKAELERVMKERDDALAESQALSQKLSESQKLPLPAASVDPEEIKQLTQERDQMRSQYIMLRGDFESLKQEKLKAKPAPAESNPGLQKEIENLRAQLAEKDREISKGKTIATGLDDVLATLKEEMNVLRDEVKKARDEASVAQRGLALSQKALQETREALKK